MSLDKTQIEALLQKDLFKELGLEQLPPEEKTRLLDDMGKILLQGVWLRLLENLNAADQDALENILGTSVDEQACMQFIREKVPQFEDIMKEEVAQYKALMLA